MDTFFFQLIDTHDKGMELLDLVDKINKGSLPSDRVFLKNTELFAQIDGSPFAYWLHPSMYHNLSLFEKYDNEGEGRGTRCGLGTLDDFRFLRLHWEVGSRAIPCRWKSYLHGGLYSPIFDEFPLVANWGNHGFEVKSFVEAKVGSASRKVQGEDRYFREGFVFPRRTRAFSPKVMPKDAIYSTAGQCGFAPAYELSWTIALMSSVIVGYIISLSQGATAKGGGPSPQFEVGLIKRLAWPNVSNEEYKEALSDLFTICYLQKRQISSRKETSLWFALPTLIFHESLSSEAFTASVNELEHACRMVAEARKQTNEIACQVYGLEKDEWKNLLRDLLGTDSAESVSTQVDPFGDGLLDDPELRNIVTECENLVAFIIGSLFGRWDVRIALDPSLTPKLPDPFDPLPVYPPGMLIGPDGLPAEPGRIVSEEWLRTRPDANTLPPKDVVNKLTVTDDDYPLQVSWDGILVDDPGFNGNHPHRDDIVGRVREVFELFWRKRSHEIEQEVCNILVISDLRDYFRKPSGFFQDHLKRYSKSRRKAPIYWPLSTASGSYTVWLYYHRLTDQTLYAAVNKYIEPKITEVDRGIGRIENDLKAISGREATDLVDQLNESQAFLRELRDLREELLRIAALPFKPDLNDGVIINAAPFYNLFRLRQWAKDTKDCWEKLRSGEYDWAHMAYTIWPDRVREVCRNDRSIAIAHGLEGICDSEFQRDEKKGGPGRRKRGGAG